MRPISIAVLLAGALSGCVAQPELPPETSCELAGPMHDSTPALDLDILLVISDAPSMAPYQEALVDNLTLLGSILDDQRGEMPSVRIMVVGPDGQLTNQPHQPGCVAPDQLFRLDVAAAVLPHRRARRVRLGLYAASHRRA